MLAHSLPLRASAFATITRIHVSSVLFAVFGDNTSGYLGFNAAVLVAVLVAVAVLRRNGELHPRLFPLMLVESTAYALLVGVVINVMLNVTGLSALLMVPMAAARDQPGLIYKLVMSVGAGLYEELVFRLLLLGVGKINVFLICFLGLKVLARNAIIYIKNGFFTDRFTFLG